MAKFKDRFGEIEAYPMTREFRRELEKSFGGAGVTTACGIRFGRNVYSHPDSPVTAFYAFTGSKRDGNMQFLVFTRVPSTLWRVVTRPGSPELRIMSTAVEAIETCWYEVLWGIPTPTVKSYRMQVLEALQGRFGNRRAVKLDGALHELVANLFGDPRSVLPLEGQLQLLGTDAEHFAQFLYEVLTGGDPKALPQAQGFADLLIRRLQDIGSAHGFWDKGNRTWEEIGDVPYFGGVLTTFLPKP